MSLKKNMSLSDCCCGGCKSDSEASILLSDMYVLQSGSISV